MVNTLKQFVGKLPTNYLSVFDHFVGLALKGLKGNSITYIFLEILRSSRCRNLKTPL